MNIVTSPAATEKPAPAEKEEGDPGNGSDQQSSSPKQSRMRRRVSIGVAALSTATAGGLVGQVTLDTHWRGLYGTLENPKFSPDPDLFSSIPPATTFYDEQESWRKSLLEKINGLDREGTRRGENASDNRFSSAMQSIDLPEIYNEENAIKLAKELIERALGSELPEAVTFRIGGPLFARLGVGGFANSLTNTVTAKYCDVFETDKENFYETVGILAHEVGHLIYRLGENKFTSMTPWKGISREVIVREEAAAVLFRLIVAAQVEDTGIQFLLSGNMDTMITHHFAGTKDYGIYEGAALADAALQNNGGDYLAAWREITSPGELDPILYEFIEGNRQIHSEVLELGRRVRDQADHQDN